MKRKSLFIAVALFVINLAVVYEASAASCTVNPTNVNFGSFSPLTLLTVDSTGSITVSCTDVVFYSVALSTGNGSYLQRSMISGGYSLDYNLYSDASFTQVWGDGTSGSVTVSLNNPVNGQNNIHTVYGRIPLNGQRGAHVGAYNDIITVTVSY